MRKRIVAVLFVVSLVIIGGVLALQPTATEADLKQQLSVSEMMPSSGGGPLVGASTLLRSKKELSMTISTTGLNPGNVHTIWWIIFNNPEMCDGDCGADDFPDTNPAVMASGVRATGLIVGDDGVGNFNASLNEGAPPVGVQVLFGSGLIDAQGAEVHLVLRDHGPAIAGTVGAQISMLNGGFPCGDCGNKQASIHLAP